MTQHPDSPRTPGATGADDELNEVTRERQQDLGHPKLDEEMDRDELGEDSPPGQNSDWIPQ
jgi:hypothetical protein